MVPHLTFRYTSKILFVRAYVQVAFQSMQTHFKIEKKKNSLLALPEKADSRKKKVKENERRANKCSFKETK